MLTLTGIKFGSVFCATGARGFYGEGYPFHKYWKKYLGMDWSGTGFAGKTVTLLPVPGNMPLLPDGTTPRESIPRSIWINFWRGEMINAVGLSNAGAAFYLRNGYYSRIKNPFFLSFICMAKDTPGREAELSTFCLLLKRYLPFRAPVALQINCGCPNSGHDLSELQKEICSWVEIAKAILGIPVVINTNAFMPTEIFLEAARVADGFWIGNTIPYGDQRATDIDWSLYGDMSPIRRRGIDADGGLSSPQCLPFTVRKVRELRASGVTLPIVAGNGIRSRRNVEDLRDAGADAVFVGSLAVVRPWAMSGVIKDVQLIF